MADAVWYYAHGDKEQGPVTLAQLKGLLSSGKIQPDDLVWKDGLDDWVPSESVPELKAGEAPVAPAPAPAASGAAARAKTPAEAAPRIEAPAKPPGGVGATPAPPPAAPPPAEEPPAEKRRSARATATSDSDKVSVSIEPRKLGRWGGWGLVVLGLLVALSTKGCDSIGQRYAASVRAAVDAGMAGYESKHAVATDASYRFWSLGRELFFLGGAILLVAGLLTNGLGGDGAEKWLCLIMLAIIVYSLFVGGAAWSGGALTH